MDEGAGACYIAITNVIFITFGAILVSCGKNLESISDTPVDYLRQITTDWTAVPFVDITVTSATTCPAGSTEVYTRPWYGIQTACDCLYHCGTDSDGNQVDGCYEMNLGETCASAQTDIGCRTVPAWPLIWQSQIDYLRVCGVNGGQPFLNVTRPSLSDGECPSGLAPCISNTALNDTLCYPEDDLSASCPITDIQIVDSTISSQYADLGYTLVSFNSSATLVYSKTVPQLPPTTIKIEAEPCMDPGEQSNSPGEQFYKPEMMRSGCTVEKNSGLTFDPRFTLSGLYSTLYQVESESNVNSILAGSPDISTYVDPSQKKVDAIRSWNRPTLNWSLSCEQEGYNRADAFDTVQTTINASDKIPKFRKIGIACCILFCLNCCQMTKGEGFLMALLSSRACMIVMGPMVGAYVYQSLNQNSNNQGKVGELASVGDCMDEYSVVNTDLLLSDLTTQESNLNLIKVFFWISISPVMLECLIGCLWGILAICDESCGDLCYNIKDNLSNLCDDLKDFCKAYILLN